MGIRKQFILAAILSGFFALQGNLAVAAPRESVRTELVIHLNHEQFVPVTNGSITSAPRPLVSSSPRLVTISSTRHPVASFLRHLVFTLMLILALCGIPVVPPHRLEQDKEDKTKTELVEDSEKPD